MRILRTLQAVLDSYKVPFEVLPHSETYSAQETAEVQRVPGDKYAHALSYVDAAFCW